MMEPVRTTESAARLGASLSDRYRIDRELGYGGMATVYLAHDVRHDRDVAIKVLRDDVAHSVGAERFLREIHLAARLNHPNIVALFDSGDVDGILFYVMPAVDGQSLRELLHATPQLPIDDAMRIVTEIASALEYAHRHGVVHRDIKPENILLHDGHALVADFGIGKALSDASGATFTQVGMNVGTPAYMSPEQAVGETVDGRSDIYSLGCVLYEMLVGEPPFTGPSVQAVIAKRFVQTPADVCALREGVPRAIAVAVQRSLARTPVDRYETAGGLIAALREVASGAHASTSSSPERSVAVLPFENMSGDRENEYFGDGIAEDIINALTRIDGLHVAARTSAFSFKGKQASLTTIGEQLRVSTVLQGSVRKSGNRLRITAQLVSVTDGYHLWSERYDRDLTDVFVVQDEIAAAIAAKLQVTFVRTDTNAERVTTNQVAAYELYVRGRALTMQRGAGIAQALECFERAIELDPSYAPAHAGLAEALRTLAQYGFVRAADAIPRAKAAIASALELDPNLGEAIGVLALIRLTSDLDASGSMELFERALAINPMLSEIRCLYAIWGLVVLRGEDVRGLAEVERALRDDPLSSICAAHASIGLSIMGRHDEAFRLAARAAELNSASFAAQLSLMLSQTWGGNFAGALAASVPVLQMSGRHPWALSSLTRVFAGQGDLARAEAVDDELRAREKTGYVQCTWLALSALALGRIDEAMELTFRSVTESDAFGPWFLRFPGIEALRAHSRFPELARLIGAERTH
jgi:serine/threonine protein kinase/tetratricopeptide (TPR) repeat protein